MIVDNTAYHDQTSQVRIYNVVTGIYPTKEILYVVS